MRRAPITTRRGSTVRRVIEWYECDDRIAVTVELEADGRVLSMRPRDLVAEGGPRAIRRAAGRVVLDRNGGIEELAETEEDEGA